MEVCLGLKQNWPLPVGVRVRGSLIAGRKHCTALGLECNNRAVGRYTKRLYKRNANCTSSRYLLAAD